MVHRMLLLMLLALSLVACRGAQSSGDAQSKGQVGATLYEYDDLDRLVKVSEADGTVITYSYDSAGNILSRDVNQPASRSTGAPAADGGGGGSGCFIAAAAGGR